MEFDIYLVAEGLGGYLHMPQVQQHFIQSTLRRLTLASLGEGRLRAPMLAPQVFVDVVIPLNIGLPIAGGSPLDRAAGQGHLRRLVSPGALRPVGRQAPSLDAHLQQFRIYLTLSMVDSACYALLHLHRQLDKTVSCLTCTGRYIFMCIHRNCTRHHKQR